MKKRKKQSRNTFFIRYFIRRAEENTYKEILIKLILTLIFVWFVPDFQVYHISEWVFLILLLIGGLNIAFLYLIFSIKRIIDNPENQ